jgi:hypothetical protein
MICATGPLTKDEHQQEAAEESTKVGLPGASIARSAVRLSRPLKSRLSSHSVSMRATNEVRGPDRTQASLATAGPNSFAKLVELSLGVAQALGQAEDDLHAG